jgi:hypothetical protein
MKNNAVIIQHVYTKTEFFGDAFVDMLRLTILRHMTYANGHDMDYWSFQGGLEKDHKMEAGAWAKIDLMKMAFEQGYEYVFWIDADAAIVDFNTDLRDAVKDIDIGACAHDPAKSEYLKSLNVPKHVNVGVMYLRNTENAKKFVDEWLASYPGIPRWAEQGSFNLLMEKYPDIVTVIDDKWNATVNVNMVEKPVVKGYHGVMPLINRFGLMRVDCIDDHINFRV